MTDTDTIQTTVAVLGGGLAGLYAGTLLQAAGVAFQLIEARDRLGGRILSVDEAGLLSEDGFDLGASWFWPHVQPQLAALVQKLGLISFAQNNDGDVMIERMSRETPWRYRATYQEPQSMRLAGGTGTLVRALAADLSPHRLRLNSCVKAMVLGERSVLLTIRKPDDSEYSLAAQQVIAALPPRLLTKVSFTPAIESTTLQRWQETATWMAPHAKLMALYDRPFWREAGFSGTAQSLVGPLVEIHDATTVSGKAALLGFLGVSAEQRSSMGEVPLVKACVDQLVRLYGPPARHPRATLLKDWAADSYTATAGDRVASGLLERAGKHAVVAMRRMDHIVIAVRHLEEAGDFYHRLGFQVGTRNQHPWGTENRLIQFSSSFIELITVGAQAHRIPPQETRRFSFGAFIRDYLQQREGLAMLALSSNNAQRDAALFAESGIGDFETFSFERNGVRPDGAQTRVAFSLAFARDRHAPDAGFFVCQQHLPENFWDRRLQRHTNLASNITAVALTTAVPERHVTFFTAFTGAEKHSHPSGQYTFALNGGRIELLHNVQARQPFLTSFTISVNDIEEMASRLAVEKIPFTNFENTIVIPNSSAFGAEIRFEHASTAGHGHTRT